MTSNERRVKNAPLDLPSDRAEFVKWALANSDENVTAGYQPPHSRLREPSTPVLRTSAAKLISLARRERQETPEQFAASAGIQVADLLALEHGEPTSAESVARVAAILHLHAAVLTQLLGLTPPSNIALIRAATEFVARLESAEPLQQREVDALQSFRRAVLERSAS